MIDLYFWATPNGYKPLLLLEEAGITHRLVPVNLGEEAQLRASFSLISPNNRIPAITDDEVTVDDRPLRLFESGAILLYLADKVGRFVPTQTAQRAEVMQWLFWQMGGVGPMFGQNLHFTQYAPQRLPYAVDRYVTETRRLLSVLDWRLHDRPFVAGAYSIADMALHPWVRKHDALSVRLADYPNVQRWFEAIAQRPAVARAYVRGAESVSAAIAVGASGVSQNPPGSGAGNVDAPSRVHALPA